MTKKLRISEEAYICLERAKSPREDFNDTLLRLIRRYEKTKFLEGQKQTLEDQDSIPLDESDD
ncbi:MAG: antitoxin VapB family protein [Candidatus Thorarchaeota archaeon]